MNIQKKILILFIISVLIIPSLSLADWKDDWGGLKTTAQDGAGLSYIDIALFTGNIIKAVLSIVGVVILIFMVYGGYLWMMSGGNEQMVRKSKDILINATIGLMIVLAAYTITNFIVGSIYGAMGGSNSTENVCINADGSYNNGVVCDINDSLGNCVNGVCEAN